VILHIPGTGERLNMQLSKDDSGLFLRTSPPSKCDVTYSLLSMVRLGWGIVECTPAARSLLDAQDGAV